MYTTSCKSCTAPSHSDTAVNCKACDSLQTPENLVLNLPEDNPETTLAEVLMFCDENGITKERLPNGLYAAKHDGCISSVEYKHPYSALIYGWANFQGHC